MNFNQLKKYWRSGSISFAMEECNISTTPNGDTKLNSYCWKNNTIHYRPGTSDAGIIYDVLLHPGRPQKPNRYFFRQKKFEYWIPQELAPKVILDIGANIGVTSLYYSTVFSDAKIHCFEPVPDNYNILKINTQNNNNITIYNVGLGDKDGEVNIYQCLQEENKGGFSLHELDVDKHNKQTITLKDTNKFLIDKNISNIDLIKIDTEGSEYDILTSLNSTTLSKVKWIIGELHGNKDFELLAYLSEWYDIDIHKNMNDRLFSFNARNKLLKNNIPWSG